MSGWNASPPWTAAEIDLVRVLVRRGLSAARIAARLEAEFGRGRSRNAVIGKIMRGGLGHLTGRMGRPLGGKAEAGAGRKRARAPSTRARQAGAASPPSAAPAAPRPVPIPLAMSRIEAESVLAKLPAPMPMAFLDAMMRDRCLHFVGDPLSVDGPGMPVCGAERAAFAPPHNRYCARHRASMLQVRP